jgi:hypothetical protein
LIKDVNPIIESAKPQTLWSQRSHFLLLLPAKNASTSPGPALILAMTFGLKCGLLLLLLSTSCAQKAPESSTYRTKGVYEGFITNMSF